MSLDIHQIASAPPAPTSAAPVASTPNVEVIGAITRHHTALAAELAALADDVIAGTRVGRFEEARTALVAWFATELMPHAHAEEAVLYAAGARLEGTRLLVEAMIAEHRALDLLVTDLDSIHDAFAVAVAAGSAQALFTVHLAKENDLLLPALDAAGIDLSAALAGMHELLGADEPDQLDVRSLPHGGRHEIIFARLDELLPGGSFVILNDHDPKPLRYQTEALWPGRFTWTYLETGPLEWRVEITRAG
ncbi:DUF2249 domain-containing protein [Pengzhenrongella frigida]|uniref:DUF2249 domain-containing protein n=1 Tax=Pengzhenrongella frigida TaxID=1259133 RepID=A0A4Q5N434_9MICO|nr:DUF2249 domain-containing protein [Cellulomonas sp. HLT2-17]RYV53018.1 DUF2249 domain-containing protein [Cellulomonas sp. HLT2-17]